MRIWMSFKTCSKSSRVKRFKKSKSQFEHLNELPKKIKPRLERDRANLFQDRAFIY